MEQDGTRREKLMLNRERRLAELDRLKVILSKLPERELNWIHRKFYGMNKNTCSLSTPLNHRKLFEQAIYRRFETNVTNRILVTWQELYKAWMEHFIPSENFKWFSSNIQIQLFILYHLKKLGIELKILETHELKNTIIEIIETHYFEIEEGISKIDELPVLQLYPLDVVDYKKNWLKFFDIAKSGWNDFQKRYIKFRWINRKNTALLNWIYTYKRRDGEKFLLNFYKPTDSDYDGKYAHILLSLNFLDNTPRERMYLKGAKVGKKYQESFQQNVLEKLHASWEKHKEAKRKKENKTPIKFNKKTLKQLDEIIEKERTTMKKAIQKAVDNYYKNLKANEPKPRMRNSKKKKLRAFLSKQIFGYYIYNYNLPNDKLSNYHYVPCTLLSTHKNINELKSS